MTISNSRPLNGCHFETDLVEAPVATAGSSTIPERVDLRSYCSPVEDQGQTNSCTANAIVGALVLMVTPTGMLLDNIAVVPQAQGRGLGRRLLELAEMQAREQGYACLDLYTHESMVENIAMYRRIGYVETAAKKEQGYQRIYMRKNL